MPLPPTSSVALDRKWKVRKLRLVELHASAAAMVTGFVLGLSFGGHCFWSCAAVMGPFIVATDPLESGSRWSSVGGAFRVVGWYNLGRLFAYLSVGAVVMLLARSGPHWPEAQAGALLVTAVVLGCSVVRPASCGPCWKPRRRNAGAFAMGLLQGLSPCPPFLVAVGIALSGPGIAAGILLFASLFVATTLFTLPLAFVEPLRRRGWLFAATRVLGGVVAVVLVARAVLLVISTA